VPARKHTQVSGNKELVEPSTDDGAESSPAETQSRPSNRHGSRRDVLAAAAAAIVSGDARGQEQAPALGSVTDDAPVGDHSSLLTEFDQQAADQAAVADLGVDGMKGQ